MPRANLKGQAEVEFLRKTVRTTFESQTNRTLIANTNKSNYIRLAEEISAVAKQNAQGTAFEKWDLTVSEGQARSLFIESNKDFLDYFVQACYFYTQGHSREVFLEKTENQALIKTWEQETLGNKGIIETNLDFQNEKEILDKRLSDIKKKFNRLKILAVLTVLALSAFFIYINQKLKTNTERLSIWSGNTSDFDSKNLMKHLGFLNPQSDFLNIVDTIVQSLYTPSVFYNGEATLPILPYKNIVNTSGYQKYNNTYYPDQISIIPFHGFSDTHLDTAKLKIRGMSSYLYRLYSQVAHQDGETIVKKDILAKIMRLDNTDFDIDLIYLGYKHNIDIADSDDFMLRYPPYKLDESELQNYVMISRQWWKEAIYKTGIHWQESFNGQKLYCGITKSYPTVRTHAPNQRTFWVEILPDSTNIKTRMVLAIDLILKK